MDQPAFSATGVSKAFGVVQALADVDFDVRPGEIVALAGENGSGKSTLSKIIAGATRPDAGSLFVNGQPVRFARPRDALDAGIALVSQEPTSVPALSVAENVLLTRLPAPYGAFRMRAFVRAAREVLSSVGVDVDPRLPFSALKPGDRELVEIAKALASSPRLVILDEATSRFGGDDVGRLFGVLRRLREQGVSSVLITHRLPEICELADRAMVLRDGRRVGMLEREELEETRIASMMVGRELHDFFHKRTIKAGDVVLDVSGLVVEGTDEPVSLTVREGEVVALAGLVGSGRTELLEGIFGARRARAGSVSVGGQIVRRSSPRASLAAGLALVPEERHRQGLNLEATVRTNVVLGTWGLLRADARRERRDCAEAMGSLRIRASSGDAPIRSLSGGNQQKVVVARCLSRRPKVLLLDEPTRGIDVGAKEEIYELIGDMLQRGMGILLVSSELLEVLGIADRVIVMHERRVIGELGRDEATEERVALLGGGGREAAVA